MKAWLAAALGSLFLVGSSSGAAIQKNGRPPERERPASSTKQVQTVDIACVAAAVAAREDALVLASAAESQTVAAAYTTRAAALKAAYNGTDPKAVKTNAKAAWDAFASTTKTAHKTFKSGRENVWNTYRTSVKACKGAEGVSDAGNASVETQTN